MGQVISEAQARQELLFKIVYSACVERSVPSLGAFCHDHAFRYMELGIRAPSLSIEQLQAEFDEIQKGDIDSKYVTQKNKDESFLRTCQILNLKPDPEVLAEIAANSRAPKL